MAAEVQITAAGGFATRLGQLMLAGEVTEADTSGHIGGMRVMAAYVLSVVTSGRGSYASGDGTAQPIETGTVTLVRPGQPHWYGTEPGRRWSEIFAVFVGPLFDTLAEAGVLPASGPRKPLQPPPTTTLRVLLRSAPTTSAAAERQLLALATWLTDVHPTSDRSHSPEVAAAVELL
ncbi:MAG TPA: AraC family ligand binding domain-containing protein, partial [Microlunatus sp.]|nr:AraC family ligand binding domain-containing protein [Microlunatus sp.]